MPAYGENDYWNDRYQNAETEHFEWYVPFLDLETKVTAPSARTHPLTLPNSQIRAAVPNVQARILVLGCGSSSECNLSMEI